MSARGARADAEPDRVEAAPAKINLWLDVLAREESGYHQIETLFCALELADRLEVWKGRGIELDVDGGDAGPAEKNLVWRAAEAFYERVEAAPAVRFRLTKHIPAGAGLGGGSSDAAAALRALNALHDRPLDRAALLRLGARLGSDVPFFLSDASLALAWGRGERLLPLPPLPPVPVLLVLPPFASATADAYQELARRRAGAKPSRVARAVRLEALCDWRDVAALARNDFELILYDRHPELAQAISVLREAGALSAGLSGSGSALYAVFADDAKCADAAPIVEAEFPAMTAVITRSAR